MSISWTYDNTMYIPYFCLKLDKNKQDDQITMVNPWHICSLIMLIEDVIIAWLKTLHAFTSS